jgi:hypothetical protein
MLARQPTTGPTPPQTDTPDADLPTATAPPQFAHLTTNNLPEGTHRPKVLITESGEIVVVVVQPEGAPGVGQVRHQAYRFDANWNQLGEPFVVSRNTAEHGEPADHRAAIVNGELVVVYQTLRYEDGSPPPGAPRPMEQYAIDQSLMLARFSLDGAELFRAPIVAHAPDPAEDTFPDRCLVWHKDRSLASTGAQGKIRIREVDLDANILDTHTFDASARTIPGEIGNSLLPLDGSLLVFSSGNPHDSAELTVSRLTGDLEIVAVTELYEESRRQTFPTGSLLHGGLVFVGIISHPRSGPADFESNPYAPYVKVLDTELTVLMDQKVGDGGFAHVHPTLALLDDRLLVAWSRRVEDGGRTVPQVSVEVFALE